MTVRILVGDCRDVLAGLPNGSVHCVVTSPPYWGLRDYGNPPSVWGGDDPACEHEWADHRQYRDSPTRTGNEGIGFEDAATTKAQRWQQSAFCTRCNAWLGSLGLEPDPFMFVEHLVEVFRGVWRVLREDGTCWINIGDSFFGSGGSGGDYLAGGLREGQPRVKSTFKRHATLKPKDLTLVPERLAIALQDAGWYVRSRIAWCKRACMPESVTDRPTSAWEHIWLLTKQPKYYYDAEAVKEDAIHEGRVVAATGNGSKNAASPDDVNDRRTAVGFTTHDTVVTGRNQRNYWLLSPSPFPGAHFATFPTEVPRRCILAGSPEKCCPTCGKGWARERQPGLFDESREQTRRAMQLFQKHGLTDAHLAAVRAVGITDTGKAAVTQNGTGRNREELQVLAAEVKAKLGGYYRELLWRAPAEATWRAACQCEQNDGSARAVVLDCFSGAGTTLLVADRLGRDGIGIELNPEYARMATDRIKGDAPLLVEVTP